jgi:hypothetical protein
LQQPLIGEDLHGGDNLLMFWSHKPVAPWQDEDWIERERCSQRPSAFQRQVLNEFAPPQSQFADMGKWDACVQPIAPVFEDRALAVWVGVDASTKRDSTALVAVHFDKKTQCVRLVNHYIFMPTPGNPIQFDQIEATLLDWHRRYQLRKILFDPMQMEAVAQRLTKAGVLIESYPQTVPNLTQCTSNLFDLIDSRRLALYSDANMRLSASRTVIVESSRGWRLDKLKQAHKIDVIVALAMACHAAVQGGNEYIYTLEPFSPDFVDLDRRPAQQPSPPSPEPPQCNGDWWKSTPAAQRQPTSSADENLRRGYAALDAAFRWGPPRRFPLKLTYASQRSNTN